MSGGAVHTIATFEGLSLVPEHDDYGPLVLAPLSFSTSFDPDQLLPLAPLPICIEELRDLKSLILALPVVFEPIQVSARTTLASIIDATHIRLGSAAGITTRTVIELLDPQNTNTVCRWPVDGVSLDAAPNITLDGTGLSGAQQAAQTAAIAAGMPPWSYRMQGIQIDERRSRPVEQTDWHCSRLTISSARRSVPWTAMN